MAAENVECTDDTQITTSTECEAAAQLLGENWNSCCQYINNLRYGCTKRVGDNDIIFNGKVDATATVGSGFRALCHAASPIRIRWPSRGAFRDFRPKL